MKILVWMFFSKGFVGLLIGQLCYMTQNIGYKQISCVEGECLQKVSAVDMYMPHWMYGNTRKDRVENQDILVRVSVGLQKRRCKETAYSDFVMCNANL